MALNYHLPSKNRTYTIIGAFLTVITLNFGTMTEAQEDGVSRFDKAVAQYRQIRDANPGSVDAHLNLGLAYVSLGAMDEAAETFKGALRLDPNDTAAYYCLGEPICGSAASKKL